MANRSWKGRPDPKGICLAMTTAQKRFEALANALAGDMFRYAYALCQNHAMAEDLVQESFMRGWRFLGDLRDESKAKSWLFCILRREHARQYERFQPPLDELHPEQIAAHPRDETPDIEVLLLRRAIRELPLKYREPLALQVVGGYNGEEIAQILEVPRATVDTRLFRARHRLRRMLLDHEEQNAATKRKTR